MELLKYRSWRWHFLHSIAKPVIRLGLGILFYLVKDAYEKKIEKGWNNPEVALFHSEVQEIIDLNWKYNSSCWYQKSMCSNPKHLDWENKDVKLWHRARAIVCVLFDEDSYYMIRALQLVDTIIRDQEKYNLAMHKKRAYWDWEEIRAFLIQERENNARRNKWRNLSEGSGDKKDGKETMV